MPRSYLLAASVMAMAALPAVTQADDSTQSAAASRDSVVASARFTAAGVKLVAGVAFAPIRRTLRDSDRAVRTVGESGRIINDSADGKLEVSPETVQAQPAPTVPYDAQDDSSASASSQ